MRVLLLPAAVLLLTGCTGERLGTIGGAQRPTQLRSQTPVDAAASQTLRARIFADRTYSPQAVDVMIFTNGGYMTLRGAVKDSAERARIAAAARSVPGIKQVFDELQTANMEGREYGK